MCGWVPFQTPNELRAKPIVERESPSRSLQIRVHVANRNSPFLVKVARTEQLALTGSPGSSWRGHSGMFLWFPVLALVFMLRVCN